MADVQATLKAKNIDLFIALVPSKSRIYDDKLAPYYIPDYFKDRYDTTLQNIQKAGIQVIDLRTALSKAQHDSFLKTDTHWTPYGARRAAQEIANTVAQQSQTFKTGDQHFETKPTKQQSHEGDLLRYVPLLPVLANQKPALDTLEIMKTISIGTQSKDIDLFGESSLPVTLVGTSYSANNLWNFSGYLKEALQSDLLNAAEEGKGPFTPMKNYLESDQFKNAAPKLIIWEIPERFLPMNYDLKKDTQKYTDKG
jgi:alginate O-acetyltransferase complex protein AlgJ